jgi:formylglycine-generating enzyme required for sulfatase activity
MKWGASLLALVALCVPTVVQAEEDAFTENAVKEVLKSFGEEFLRGNCFSDRHDYRPLRIAVAQMESSRRFQDYEEEIITDRVEDALNDDSRFLQILHRRERVQLQQIRTELGQPKSTGPADSLEAVVVIRPDVGRFVKVTAFDYRDCRSPTKIIRVGKINRDPDVAEKVFENWAETLSEKNPERLVVRAPDVAAFGNSTAAQAMGQRMQELLADTISHYFQTRAKRILSGNPRPFTVQKYIDRMDMSGAWQAYLHFSPQQGGIVVRVEFNAPGNQLGGFSERAYLGPEALQMAVATNPDAPTPRRDSPLTAVQERALKPKDSFRECANCPEMVVVPAGSFTMGSPPDNEEGRWDNEGPQHDVTIGKAFAVGKLHVTRDEYAAFVNDTGYVASTTCHRYRGGSNASWRDPGLAQEGLHPVVCVTWDDAKAYVNWLVKKTGKPYRLLTEAEFEYAARGQTHPGTYTRFWFGDDENILCEYASSSSCGHVGTSPAGQYKPNAFGLYDMAGNAWQWTEDCWHDSYQDAPADGSAWTAGTCAGRVVRGGAWNDFPRALRAAARYKDTASFADFWAGFRLARTLRP